MHRLEYGQTGTLHTHSHSHRQAALTYTEIPFLTHTEKQVITHTRVHSPGTFLHYPHTHAFVHLDTHTQKDTFPQASRRQARAHTHTHTHPSSHGHRQITFTPAQTPAGRPTHTPARSHTRCRGTRGQLCGCSCDLEVPGACLDCASSLPAPGLPAPNSNSRLSPETVSSSLQLSSQHHLPICPGFFTASSPRLAPPPCSCFFPSPGLSHPFPQIWSKPSILSVFPVCPASYPDLSSCSP